MHFVYLRSNALIMRFSAFLILFLSSLAVSANVLVYTGVYQGRDLYVKNPFAPDGVGFCVFEVRVNGEVTSDEWNSSAFAIDFAVFGLAIGDPVEVVIRTKDSCEPRVINPEVIAPESTFDVVSMAVGSAHGIRFSTINESAPLLFEIEQFKWNKWVKVATVEGKGESAEPNAYQAGVPLHSGINTFRVSQSNLRGARRSKSFELEGPAQEIALLSDRISGRLEFSGDTDYEVFDAFGVVVTRGFGKVVDATAWKPGTYFVNFDRSFGQSIRKR